MCLLKVQVIIYTRRRDLSSFDRADAGKKLRAASCGPNARAIGKGRKRKTERRATVHRFLRKDAIFRGETGRFQQETTCFGVFHKNELVVKKVLKQDNFFQKFEKNYLLAQ